MVDLEDFSPFVELKREERPEKNPLEELEERYRQEILKLQASFRQEIERVREEAFRKGFEEGYQKGVEELGRKLKEREEALKKEFEKRLGKIKLNTDSLLREIESEKEKRLRRVEEAIVGSITEIFEFLYLNPSNAPFLREKISELIEEFRGEEVVEIEAGEKLALALEGERVKVSPELGDYDFRIVFKDFAVESNFKEKLNLLREEIEREIKKNS